jgi:3-hydroxyacyl-[acyl-carrier-protein] dehydratase
MMTLLHDYFEIESRTADGDGTVFQVALLPECGVYAGHFPGNPVSPGVCNIQMIKECAELLAGKRFLLGYISQCRFSAVVTPQATPRLRIHMQLSGEGADGVQRVRATVDDTRVTYVDFKGELTPVK